MVFKRNLTIILFIISASFQALAQSSSGNNEQAAKSDTTKALPVLLDRVWVANELKSSNEKLKTINGELIPEAMITRFDSIYNSEIDKLRKEKGRFDSIENFTSVRDIDDQKNKWSSRKEKYNGWTQDITAVIKELQEDEYALSLMGQTWDSVLLIAKKEEISGEQINSVGDLLVNLNKSKSELSANINTASHKQSLIGNLEAVVDSVFFRLDEEKKSIQSDYFLQDAPEIWRATDTSINYSDVKAYWSKSYEDTKIEVKAFFNTNKGLIVFNFIIFMMIWAGYYFLYRYSTKYNEEVNDPELLKARKVVSSYGVSSFIISLFFSVWIYPSIGSTMMDFWQLSFLIIAFIFLPSYLDKRLKRVLLVIIILFILDVFQMWFPGKMFLARMIMLTEGLISAYILFRVISKNNFIAQILERNKWGIIITIFKVFLILSLVSIVGNIFGFVDLSLLLSNTIVNALVNIIILILALMVLNRTVSIVLRTPYMQQSHVIEKNYLLIEKRIFQIVQIFGIILWFRSSLNTLGILEEIELWLSKALNTTWDVGDSIISLWGIIKFILTLIITVFITRILKLLLNEEFYPRVKLPRGVPGAITMISSYIIVLFGIFISLMEAGVNLSEFGLIAGALSVGIGFGLQGIVANFIAGIVLAFERPIQVGDQIQMDLLHGTVRNIGVRSTTVRTYDGSEVIIPNSDLIVKDVTNWTLSDRKKRRDIYVNVAYGTNPHVVMELIKKVANDHPDVLKVPAPWALFEGFGDSSLNFRVRVWTLMDNGMTVQSAVAINIYDALMEAGIEIPFPQRDLHLRSMDKNISDAIIYPENEKVKKPDVSKQEDAEPENNDESKEDIN